MVVQVLIARGILQVIINARFMVTLAVVIPLFHPPPYICGLP